MDLSNKLAIDEINLANKRVLIRVDFNVPMEYGRITDSKLIRESLETICYALDHDARSVILISHVGRPDGERNMQYSLAPVATELRKLLRRPVTFLHDCVGEAVELVCMDPAPGSVILLENLRFHIEEEGANSKMEASPEKVKEFRECLRKLADIYVSDAFNIAHKYHSSVLAEGYDLKVAGLLMKRELICFTMPLTDPLRPYLAILGGAQVKDKLLLIDKLLGRVDEMIVGGGMAFTFLAVTSRLPIGDSLYDDDCADYVQYLLEKSQRVGVPIYLPVDFVITDKFAPDAEPSFANNSQGIPNGYMGMDIGPYTVANYTAVINRANLILWNGPMGVYEWENFEEGTRGIMEAVASRTEQGATTIIGGADIAAACEKFNATDRMTHVSKGGPACLDLLEENDLPGVHTLTSKLQPCPCKCSIDKDASKKDKRKYEPVEMMKPKRDIRRSSRVKNLIEKDKKDKQRGRQMSDEYGNEYLGAEGDQMSNYLTDEYGNVITDENGNPILKQMTDANGNPIPDPYGEEEDEEGGEEENQYGNQMTDEFGNPTAQQYGYPKTDEYGNPIAQEYGYPTTDQYGNPTTDEYGNAATDAYGNPLVGQTIRFPDGMASYIATQMGPPLASAIMQPGAPLVSQQMEIGTMNQMESSAAYQSMGQMANQMDYSMGYPMTTMSSIQAGYNIEYPMMVGFANQTGVEVSHSMAGGVAPQTGVPGIGYRVGGGMVNPRQGVTANQMKSNIVIPHISYTAK